MWGVHVNTRRCMYRFIPLVMLFVGNNGAAQKQSPHAITYELNQGGRLGDNLLSYSMCKYFSWKYHIPLLYKQFSFSDQLQLHKQERSLTTDDATKKFKRTERLEQGALLNKHDDPTLYVTTFYLKGPDWKTMDELIIYILEHPSLRRELQRMIAPRKKITSVLPLDTISVAVHVRKGGGFDQPLLSESRNGSFDKKCYSDCRHPLKFPPDSFYIRHIASLSEQLGNKPMYVYIFTDDKNPRALTEKYQRAVNKANIVFDYYKKCACFEDHQLEDLFFMQQFDYLIRPKSSFSMVAHILGNHRCVIYPRAAHWDNSNLIIDEVGYLHKVNDAYIEKVVVDQKS
jgi:hypothetical protein